MKIGKVKQTLLLVGVLFLGAQTQATSVRLDVIGEPLVPTITWYSIDHHYLVINPPFNGDESLFFVKDSNPKTGEVFYSDTALVSKQGKVSVRVSGLSPDTGYDSYCFFRNGDSTITESWGMNKTYPLPPRPKFWVGEEAYLGISDILVVIDAKYPVKVYALYGDNYQLKTEEFLQEANAYKDTLLIPIVTQSYGEYPYVLIYQYSDSTNGDEYNTHDGLLKVIKPEPIAAPALSFTKVESDCGEVSFCTRIAPVLGDTAHVVMYVSDDDLSYIAVDSASGIYSLLTAFTFIDGLDANKKFFIRAIATSKDGLQSEVTGSVWTPEGDLPTLNITPRLSNLHAEFNFAGYGGCSQSMVTISVEGEVTLNDTVIFVEPAGYNGTVDFLLEPGDYTWSSCVSNIYGKTCREGSFKINGLPTNMSLFQTQQLRSSIPNNSLTVVYDTMGRVTGNVTWGEIKNPKDNPLILNGMYIITVPDIGFSEKRFFYR